MSIIQIIKPATGPQVFIFRRRIHHGIFGIFSAIFGIGLAIHDRKDWKTWL